MIGIEGGGNSIFTTDLDVFHEPRSNGAAQAAGFLPAVGIVRPAPPASHRRGFLPRRANQQVGLLRSVRAFRHHPPAQFDGFTALNA